jgi:aminopeptidase N
MRKEEGDEAKRKFELPGSRAHYAPSLLFTINHMQLYVELDLDARAIECKQRLDITILQDTDSIELDAAELRVKSVSAASKLEYRTIGDKIVVKLGRIFKEESKIKLDISYSARPRKGLYFVSPDKHYPRKQPEAWTQSETTEAMHWFPCIDHPQVRFTSALSIAVPTGFMAISNGKLVKVERRGKKHVYHWLEGNSHPAYLTSMVVGKYVEISEGSILRYYVPAHMKQDALRTFDHTPEMVKFFEDYLGTKYPYDKYSQVAVQDFIYGGMENSSCTTVTIDTLHDKKAHLDFTSDHLVSHELAHQWFGDLVTCRDWQHVWLNEAFATYCEALYWQASRGTDEFQYYIMRLGDDYFEEAVNRYARPIVTKIYKYPDELFDRHTYEKGGCVLHMLRHHIGDRHFRRSLRTFLQRFANGAAETDDFRKVVELETSKSLQQFFDQWVFREGHPSLKVEYSSDGKVANLKIEQTQPGDPFDFSLEVKAVFARGEKLYVFKVSEKESAFQIPLDTEIEWFSIDPQFKILKTVSIKVPKEMLIQQLRGGKTVVERVEAARALKDNSSEEVINALQEAILHDRFWGVSAEAAKTLELIKTDYAYEVLKKCLKVKHPKARRAIVRALGEFKKEESFELLKPLLNGDDSYFVESEAATAIGKTKSKQAIAILKKAAESTSFQNIVAQGAINGLKEFGPDKEIASFLIEKSRYGNYHRVREAATFALGKFIDTNPPVSDHLKSLLADKWFRVRISACRAFADAEAAKAIPDLTWVSENDIDHRVRRVAEECINLIRDAARKPKEVAQIREELDRVKSKNLELFQKVDRLEGELH